MEFQNGSTPCIFYPQHFLKMRFIKRGIILLLTSIVFNTVSAQRKMADENNKQYKQSLFRFRGGA